MPINGSPAPPNAWIDIFQLAALDNEASEALSLIRSMRNKFVPVNRLPCDVLALIPDFWHGRARENIAITLTHVCQDWREIFGSRASLWTNFHLVNAEKTRCYLERSKSAPISVSLERPQGLLHNDPFLEVVPGATSRLKRLYMRTTSGHLQAITQHLVDPAPLLETLKIHGSCVDPHISSVPAPHLFNGNLSSLRELSLRSVRTQLPWRGMNNLTSFTLCCTAQTGVSIEQTLDFLGGAPRLRKVWLSFAASTPGPHNRRPASLAHLESLTISGSQRPSLLLNHLMIPVGAVVWTELDSLAFDINDHLPRSLDNLGNLSHFTEIRLLFAEFVTSVRFTGPNGQVHISSSYPTPGDVQAVFRSLTRLDTSRTEFFEIIYGGFPAEFFEALRSLTNLRTLIISRCCDTLPFLLGLRSAFCPNNSIICPRLEELVFYTDDSFDEKIMVDLAAIRASGGAPLELVKVVSSVEPMLSAEGVTELLKHVSDVETGVEDDDGVNYFGEIPVLAQEVPF